MSLQILIDQQGATDRLISCSPQPTLVFGSKMKFELVKQLIIFIIILMIIIIIIITIIIILIGSQHADCS